MYKWRFKSSACTCGLCCEAEGKLHISARACADPSLCWKLGHLARVGGFPFPWPLSSKTHHVLHTVSIMRSFEVEGVTWDTVTTRTFNLHEYELLSKGEELPALQSSTALITPCRLCLVWFKCWTCSCTTLDYLLCCCAHRHSLTSRGCLEWKETRELGQIPGVRTYTTPKKTVTWAQKWTGDPDLDPLCHRAKYPKPTVFLPPYRSTVGTQKCRTEPKTQFTCCIWLNSGPNRCESLDSKHCTCKSTTRL